MQEKETTKLQEIILAPITCTLPLIELIKVKPKLWEGLTEKLVEQGVLNKGHLNDVVLAKTIVGSTIDLNKVDGITSKDKGNTTLPVNYKGIESIAILDSGVGISIATKTIWEKWEKPTIRQGLACICS